MVGMIILSAAIATISFAFAVATFLSNIQDTKFERQRRQIQEEVASARAYYTEQIRAREDCLHYAKQPNTGQDPFLRYREELKAKNWRI